LTRRLFGRSLLHRELARTVDWDWVAARDSDRVVAMDSEVAVSTDSNRENSAQ
jgi:hypothetical protein